MARGFRPVAQSNDGEGSPEFRFALREHLSVAGVGFSVGKTHI
jgi:hypothetical protein